MTKEPRKRHSSDTRNRVGVGADVERVGLPRTGLRDFYHFTLLLPVWTLLCGVTCFYLTANLLFALGYYYLGGVANLSRSSFADCFFFSIETMSTVGYGYMYPVTTAANTLMSIELVFGLLLVALSSGLMFARFSRPTARVSFSKVAVITPFDGVPTLMFRAANQRRNQIIEANMSVSMLRNELSQEGHLTRRFHDVALVRSRTPVFALSWLVMHRIDETSPFWEMDLEALHAVDATIVCSMTGIDDTFVQTIYARYTYEVDNLRWGHKFADMFTFLPDGRTVMDYRQFHETLEE